ncbi:hypothetical protein FSST1_007640 [Fusarium sambucinum]
MDTYSGDNNLLIGIDFGETNTAVSHVQVPMSVDSKHIPTSWIRTIRGYPSGIDLGKGDPMCLEVPTQLFYPKGWIFRPLDELWDAPPGPVNTLNIKSQSRDSRLLWGYQVSQHMSHVASHSKHDGTLVHRFKTLMDQSENHKQHKQSLSSDLRLLSMNRSCRKEIPVNEMVLLVTIDFLTKLLEFLKRRIYDSRNTSTIVSTEIIICVPVNWGQKATRDMQLCMVLAAKLSGFPGLRVHNKSMDNVFIMAEPEAGATWILPRYLHHLQPGETILIVDKGGGTVDAQTYELTKTYPLRLKRQPIRHSGDSCGSNALNEAFFKLILKKLDGHEYLEDQPGVTIEGIAKKMAFDTFENGIKKSWDTFDMEQPDCIFEVHGIKYDPSFPHDKGHPNRLTVTANEMQTIFQGVFKKVYKIIATQLEAALNNGININTVVLMGGFALSMSLCQHLEVKLDHLGQDHRRTYRIVNHADEDRMATIDAVGSGAVLRALNKEDGPSRVAKTAYGLGVFVRYDKKLHGIQKPIDGIQNPREKWIKTIQWVSKLGEVLPPMHEKNPYIRCCQFPYHDSDGKRKKEFIIRDEIYLSDFASEDDYSIDHERNQDAEFIGYIYADVTHLANTFLCKRVKGKGRHQRGSRKYWEFHYDLVYQIDGLNMKCIQRRGDEILGELGVNIASALPPGAA